MWRIWNHGRSNIQTDNVIVCNIFCLCSPQKNYQVHFLCGCICLKSEYSSNRNITQSIDLCAGAEAGAGAGEGAGAGAGEGEGEGEGKGEAEGEGEGAGAGAGAGDIVFIRPEQGYVCTLGDVEMLSGNTWNLRHLQ